MISALLVMFLLICISIFFFIAIAIACCLSAVGIGVADDILFRLFSVDSCAPMFISNLDSG